MDFRRIVLARDGQRPLAIHGQDLAAQCGQWQHGTEHNRFVDITVYAIEGGKFAVAWAYYTRWQGETDHHQVEVCSSLDEVATALENLDPCQWLVGFKPQLARAGTGDARDTYSRRQEAIEHTLRTLYQERVSQICEALDIAEEL